MTQNQDDLNQVIIVALPVTELLLMNISQASHMIDFAIQTLELSNNALSQVLKQIESEAIKVDRQQYKNLKHEKKMVNLYLTQLKEVLNRLIADDFLNFID